MKGYEFRIIIAAVFACLCLQANGFAQKNKKPAPKSKVAPKTNVKTEQKISMSALEEAVANEINEARSDPKKYLPFLEEYKKALKGNVLYLSNSTGVATIEGAGAINEAIDELKKMKKADSFTVSAGLNRIAKNHLEDLMQDATLGHTGKDGGDLTARFSRIGFTDGKIAENISYQVDKALEVVLTMIIDDGIKSRSHRKNIFSDAFKLLGIACGKGKSSTALCVAEFAGGFTEKK